MCVELYVYILILSLIRPIYLLSNSLHLLNELLYTPLMSVVCDIQLPGVWQDSVDTEGVWDLVKDVG